MMRNQTEKTTKGSSITDGIALPRTERKCMRVIDFTQAKTPAEKQELFFECRKVIGEMFDRRQIELSTRRKQRRHP